MIYPGGQLYDGDKAAKAVQLGNVQMTNEPNSAFTSYTKNADLMEIPFGFADPDEFQKFLEGPKRRRRAQGPREGRLPRAHVLRRRPVRDRHQERADPVARGLQGPAASAPPGHPVVVDGLKGMGASTAKIPLNEVYSALQQGTITGVYTTFDAFVNEKMYEVAPNVMIIPSYGAYFWVANKAWFDAQPEADRKLMDTIAAKLGKHYDKDIWADDGQAHRDGEEGRRQDQRPGEGSRRAQGLPRGASRRRTTRCARSSARTSVDAILASK